MKLTTYVARPNIWGGLTSLLPTRRPPPDCRSDSTVRVSRAAQTRPLSAWINFPHNIKLFVIGQNQLFSFLWRWCICSTIYQHMGNCCQHFWSHSLKSSWTFFGITAVQWCETTSHSRWFERGGLVPKPIVCMKLARSRLSHLESNFYENYPRLRSSIHQELAK